MLMPSIFGENLFDDFMDVMTMPTLSGSCYRTTPTQNVMRTDIREGDDNYEIDIDLPGYKKEDVSAELKEGYLTINACCKKNNEEKDDNGRYIRRERYSGSVSRSFYVGENLTEEDIKAKFEDGILKLSFPKEQPKKVEEKRYISIDG